MWPILLLAFSSAVLGAERSEAAQGRQVVLTQLIFPHGQQQPAGAGKFVEAAAPVASRQVSYNFPQQLRPNFIDGFQYYPVYPGQAPVHYGANQYAYYPQGYAPVPAPPPYPVSFGKDENAEGGSSYWPSWATEGFTSLAGYFPAYPSSSPEQQQPSNSESSVEASESGQDGTKKPQKLQQQKFSELPQFQQQQFQSQQEQQYLQAQQQPQRQQIKQQPQQSYIFTNQLYPGSSEYPSYPKEGAPAATSNSAASAQLPQLIFAGQPQFAGPYAPFSNRGSSQDPAKLTVASHGAISNYLFLKNQPQLPVYQQTQQRYDNAAVDNRASVGRPTSATAGSSITSGSEPASASKRFELEKYSSISADAKNQRSPLYAQHVSAVQVSADPAANIQGSAV